MHTFLIVSLSGIGSDSSRQLIQQELRHRQPYYQYFLQQLENQIEALCRRLQFRSKDSLRRSAGDRR